jgi:hypothetical protein
MIEICLTAEPGNMFWIMFASHVRGKGIDLGLQSSPANFANRFSPRISDEPRKLAKMWGKISLHGRMFWRGHPQTTEDRRWCCVLCEKNCLFMEAAY